MANASSCSGDITIRAKSKKSVQDILELMSFMKKGEYYTCITEEKESERKYRKLSDDESAMKVEYEAKFYGSGRWEYRNNVEYMFHGNWLINRGKKDAHAKELLKKLKSKEWEIEFSFADEECGMEVLYEAVMTVIHKAGKPVSECDVQENSYEDYPYTWPYLMNIAGYDKEWIHGDLDMYTDDLEYLQEKLDDGIGDMMDYYGHSRDIVIQMLDLSYYVDLVSDK